MDLIAFRVKMYKGIRDSGWIKVNPLTVLVGKNESGKTSLLRALHKLNPDTQDLYDIAKEWPRAQRIERNEEQEVCVAKFELSNQDKANLRLITEREEIPNAVEVSRNYAGQLEVNFEDSTFLDGFDPSVLSIACETLPNVKDEFGDQFKQAAETCLEETRNLLIEGHVTELTELIQKHAQLLQEATSSSVSPRSIENDFIAQYVAASDGVVQKLDGGPSLRLQVQGAVSGLMPKFIYMSDYRTFRGTAQLDEIKARRDDNRLTDEDNTFLIMLNLSNLDLDELIRLGQGDAAQLEQRKHNLNDGAATLTKKFSGRLRQRDYEITFHVDGQCFLTYVSDNHDPALMGLEERSKGFQWFFSFNLMLMHESKGTFRGCVLLLDEPGLHLHPDAQDDLMRWLKDYSGENTLFYTTHLPFMIDLNYPDGIRVLKETDDGIVVTTAFVESPPEAKLVLQAALGMKASQSFLVAKHNLVVEGVDDYWILTELSNLLRRDGKEGLPEGVLITPGGGASIAVHVATFMIGQNLNVVALFDSDNEGRKCKRKLECASLAEYTESHTQAILLGDAVGSCGDFAIEDLFPENFITDIVKDVYSKELASVAINEIVPQGSGILWKRIVCFMRERGIKIDKSKTATRLRKKLSNMETASELPDETRCKAIKLFKEIHNALGEGETESS